MIRNNLMHCLLLLVALWHVEFVAQQISEAALRNMKPSHIERLLNDARQQKNQALVKQLENYLMKIGQVPKKTISEGKWYWLPVKSDKGQWVWVSASGGLPVSGPATPGAGGLPFTSGVPTVPQPTTPPEGSTGPGRWQWFSQQEGEGQWGWIDENTGTVIGGPASSTEGTIIALPEELPETVQPTLPQPTEIPTPPTGGPPIPPIGAPTGPGGVQPPTGPSLEEQLAAKRKAESTMARVLQPLDAAVLARLTQQEKEASDKLLSDAVKKIAHEVFVKAENVAKKTKVQVGQRQKELDTPFLAYQWFIKEVLIQEVGMKDQFKKRQELIDLIGEEDTPGELFEFINQVLKKGDSETLEQFLLRIKNNLGRYSTDMLALFDSCVFNVASFRQQEIENAQTIIVNCAVTQRPGVEVHKTIVRGIEKEVSKPKGLQKPLNQRAVQNFIRGFVSKLRRAADEIGTLSEPLEDQGKLLMKVLRDELNILRLNPEFYRFDTLTSSALRSIANSLSGVERNQRLPLLDVLDIYDEQYIKDLIVPMNVKAVIDGTLFFDKEEANEALGKLINFQIKEKPEDPATADNPERAKRDLEQWLAIQKQLNLTDQEIASIIVNNDLFKKAVSDYATRVGEQMRARKEALDPYDIINEPLKNATNYEGIKEVLQSLKKIAGTPTRNKIIDAIIKELNHSQFTPNINQIINGFRQLTGKQQLEFEQNITNRINAFIDQNKNVAKVLRVLNDYVQAHKTRIGRKPTGGELIGMLEQEIDPGVFNRFKDQLKGIKRTAKSVYEALLSLARKRKAVTDIIKEEEFYKLIEPYGLLMMILEGWAQKAPGKPAEEQLQSLYNSLELLNHQQEMFKEGTQYVEGLIPAGSTDEKKLSDYKGVIYARMYANKLTELIKNLRLFQFDKVKTEIQQLVAAAGIGAENDPDFDTIITKFQQTFAQLLFISIVDQLKKLNTGEATIEGLPVNKYVDLYVDMKDQLTPVLNILAPGGNPRDDLSALDVPGIEQDLDNFKQQMQKIINTFGTQEKQTANKRLDDYIARLKKIIRNLKQFAPTSAAGGIPQVPGGGIPLPPAGGPPPVPAGGPRLPRT